MPRRTATLRATYRQVCEAPELAVLAVLDAALETSILAVAAACPELHDVDDDRRGSPEPVARAARDLIDLARALTHVVRRYRRECDAERRRHVNLPF